MRDILAARLLRQLILHLLWQCPWNISYDISCVCVYRRNFSAICCLSLEYDHLRAYTSRKGECHNNNADDWKPSLHARKNGETPSRHSSAEVNEASNSWKCEGKALSWWQGAESAETLHDPASTAECSHMDCRRLCLGGGSPSFPPFSIFHPARTRLLQHKGLEQHNLIPIRVGQTSWQYAKVWQHKRVRLLLDIYVNHERRNGQLCLSLNGLKHGKQLSTQSLWNKHSSEHLTSFR